MMISNKVDFYFRLYVFFKEKNNFMEQPSFWNRISIVPFQLLFEIFPQGKKKTNDIYERMKEY